MRHLLAGKILASEVVFLEVVIDSWYQYCLLVGFLLLKFCVVSGSRDRVLYHLLAGKILASEVVFLEVVIDSWYQYCLLVRFFASEVGFVEVVGVFLSFIFVTFWSGISFGGEIAARLEFLISCSSFRNMATMVAAVTCGRVVCIRRGLVLLVCTVLLALLLPSSSLAGAKLAVVLHCQILFVSSVDRILCWIAHLHRIKPCANFFLSLNCCYGGKMMYHVLATSAALVIHPRG